MDGDNIHLLISLAFLVISVIVTIIGCCTGKKENFDPKYKTDKKQFIDNVVYNSTHEEVLSNGVIQKYKIKGLYRYEFLYNLPDASASFQVVDLNKAFNAAIPKNKYKVFAGKTKDDMEYIGDLERRGDGYHVLFVESDKEYRKACIVYKDDVVQCSKI